MKFLLAAVMLAFFWQVTPAEFLTTPSAISTDSSGGNLDAIAALPDAAFTLPGGFEGGTWMPVLGSARWRLVFPSSPSQKKICDYSAEPFLALSVGVVAGLPPPRA